MDVYTEMMRRLQMKRREQERNAERVMMIQLREQALDDDDLGLYDYSSRRLREL